MIKTQIGGKFSKDENGLFELRKRLIASNINVEFPFNDGIVGEYKGIGVTFIPTSERTFYDIEIEFFEAIRRNPVHIVHNKYIEQIGYIGESTSIELGYAIIHNTPIIFLYPPIFSDKVSDVIKKLITDNISLIHVKRLDILTQDELNKYIVEVSLIQPKYDYKLKDELEVIKTVDNLLNSYLDK